VALLKINMRSSSRAEKIGEEMALKILVERRHALKFILSKSIIGILYLSGAPILPHLLRYRAFAVDDHSCIPCASHLQQPRLVNNPG